MPDDEAKFKEFMKHATVRQEADPVTGEPRQVIGVEIGLPGREYVRTRRCQNCVHYHTQNDQVALIHLAHCVLRDAKILARTGKTRAEVSRHIAMLRRTIGNHLELGTGGRCDAGGSAEDFVDYRFLCDRWTGHEKAEVPVSQDPLPGELYDKLGEPDPSSVAAGEPPPDPDDETGEDA